MLWGTTANFELLIKESFHLVRLNIDCLTIWIDSVGHDSATSSYKIFKCVRFYIFFCRKISCHAPQHELVFSLKLVKLNSLHNRVFNESRNFNLDTPSSSVKLSGFFSLFKYTFWHYLHLAQLVTGQVMDYSIYIVPNIQQCRIVFYEMNYRCEAF